MAWLLVVWKITEELIAVLILWITASCEQPTLSPELFYSFVVEFYLDRSLESESEEREVGKDYHMPSYSLYVGDESRNQEERDDQYFESLIESLNFLESDSSGIADTRRRPPDGQKEEHPFYINFEGVTSHVGRPKDHDQEQVNEQELER